MDKSYYEEIKGFEPEERPFRDRRDAPKFRTRYAMLPGVGSSGIRRQVDRPATPAPLRGLDHHQQGDRISVTPCSRPKNTTVAG
jgi:hypothetical protein